MNHQNNHGNTRWRQRETGELHLEGYTNHLSVQAGEPVAFHISTNTPKYSVEVARIGARREVVWSKEDLRGEEFPVPKNASTHGCGWPTACELKVPEDWRSGYYSAVLSGVDSEGRRTQGEIAFVVRSSRPGRHASILLQRTTNTDDAYNVWGGSSFYNGPHGAVQRASFDRPFAGFPGSEKFLFDIDAEHQRGLDERIVSESLAETIADHGIQLIHRIMDVEKPGDIWHIFDAGIVLTLKKRQNKIAVHDGFSTWESCWHHWEQHFVRWAETAGYQIDYAVNSDLEFHPEILKHYRLVLSVGHDEYWSSPMRDHLESFVSDGGNVAFLSGNDLQWQVRSEDQGRALVCWKQEFEKDEAYARGENHLLTTCWCHHLINRPENHLTGVSFAYGGYHGFFDQYREGPFGYTVHRPDHWIFEGTGLKRGDWLGVEHKIVSYECDGCDFELKDGLPIPTHHDGTPDTFQILATAPAALSETDNSLALETEALYGPGSSRQLRQPGVAVLGIYQRGGTVVTSGCTDWAFGLKGGDKSVDRITRNILDRLSK